MTVIRNYSHMCACATYGCCGYYLRVVLISLRASDCAAIIRGQRLFEEIEVNRNGMSCRKAQGMRL